MDFFTYQTSSNFDQNIVYLCYFFTASQFILVSENYFEENKKMIPEFST